MQRAALAHEADWDGFRSAARALALAGVPPEEVVWTVAEDGDLFGEAGPPPGAVGSFNVPRALVELAQLAALARDPERFALIYRLIWRAHQGERRLMEQATDAQLRRVTLLAQAVRRDMHKMRAFVRFREVKEPAGVRYVAWFEPDHYIVEANAPFFVRRFATMQWSILTPYRSAHWSGSGDVMLGPGAERADVPDDDRLEAHWRAYFSAIFNPARLKVGAMTSEMPRKYWRNLPEAAAIPDLIRAAQGRVDEMLEQNSVTEMPLARTPMIASEAPGAGTLPDLAREAADCRRCALWKPATQTVFGEGPPDARIMLVGEQPGDQEDLAGRPFVGPAGQLLDRALAEAGLDRAALYVTNAVKHFKFEPRGKRRIHQTPERAEVVACKVWLDAERAQVRPSLIVLLGATAARAVLERAVTIGRERGRAIQAGEDTLFVTVHPSYLLRLPDAESKAREYAAFVRDLKTAASIAASAAAP
jgi:DNA polymerase